MASHASLRSQAKASREAALRRVMKADRAEDTKMVAKAVHKHERAMHPGKPETKIEGAMAKGGRLDRYARGGRTKAKKPGNVNVVVVAGGGQKPEPVPVPIPAGPPPGGPVAGLGAPPMPPPGPPPGMPAGLPPGMMKRGGVAKKRAAGGAVKDDQFPPERGDDRPPMPLRDGSNDDKNKPGRPVIDLSGKLGKYRKGGEVHMTAGALSGEGRLQKTAIVKKARRS